MTRNISVSIKNSDEEDIVFLEKNLPWGVSRSDFIIECTKKGVEQLKQKKIETRDEFMITDFSIDKKVAIPSLLLDFDEYRKKVKDMTDYDLRILQSLMQEKAKLVERIVSKRFG